MSDTAETGESTPRKKAAATKSAAKKSAAKKSTVRKAAARTAPKRTQPGRGSESARGGGAVNGARLAYLGAEQLVELTRKPFEGVVGLNRTDDGWTVEVEVLELRRIPETTDIIGVYEVSVDSSGELESYRRVHRYLRGEAGEER
jgi:Gas vesicle synthesis protein GvpO